MVLGFLFCVAPSAYLAIGLGLVVIFGFHNAGPNCSIPVHSVLVSSVKNQNMYYTTKY